MDREIDLLRQDLASHMTDCNKRFDEGQDRFNTLIACTEANTIAVNKLINETQGVVQLYRDVESVYRVGKAVQNFGLWVVKWPIIGGGLLAMYLWLTENFSK